MSKECKWACPAFFCLNIKGPVGNMTNELLALFEYYEKEKGIKRETMVEALETALLSASKKSIGPARDLRIHIDPDKGDIKAFATLLVKDRVESPYDEIDIFTARRLQ